MTVTVPTLALVLPVMAVWVVGYYLVAHNAWVRCVDSMLLDNDVTPGRFIGGLARSVVVGSVWPVALVLKAFGRDQR